MVGWSRTKSTITDATYWPTVPAPDDDDDDDDDDCVRACMCVEQLVECLAGET
jgi:hypothetical protein